MNDRIASLLTAFPAAKWRRITGQAPVRDRAALRSALLLTAELVAVIAWAVWLGRAYLNVDPHVWPAGTAMGGKLLGHYFWVNLKACGACALWNGSLNGGAPALADRFGSQLHPLVMVVTLLWGVMGGAKIAIIALLVLAGLAQWWIAHTLGLGAIARLWSACLAIAAGHLAATQDEGSFGILLSLAMASLTLAAAFALGVRRARRYALILALLGALTLVSGQGYVQLALLSCAPAVLILILDDRWHWSSLWREYLLAFVLCLLLAAVWLVPTLHFWPNLNKDYADPNFGFAQPLQYAPLNLVISDLGFYRLPVLGRQVNANILYIGWLPVVCALLVLRFGRRADARPLLALALAAASIFVVASAIPLRWLAAEFPFFLGFRFATLITGLAVVPILGLAAYGLDALLRLPWPRISIALADGRSWQVSSNLLLVALALLSLASAYRFSHAFFFTRNMSKVYELVASAFTLPDRQWVSPPYGEWDWIEPSIATGSKVTGFRYSGAGWSGRPFPEPSLILERNAAPEGSVLVGDVEGVPLYHLTGVNYAAVRFDGGVAPCQAAGQGGDISVLCESALSGQLVVQENAWSGWQVWRDGKRVQLQSVDSPWLTVEAPAGRHEYRFLYRPWDAPLGLAITLLGVAVMILLWIRSGHPQEAVT